MKPSDYLKRGHVKGMSACDSGGKMCAPSSERAVRWCLVGYGVGAWNNAPERTQAEVVALAEQVELELGIE